jgi:hypothetical protein
MSMESFVFINSDDISIIVLCINCIFGMEKILADELSQYEVAQSGIGKDSCIFNLEKIINALPYVLLSICYCVIFILCTSL